MNWQVVFWFILISAPLFVIGFLAMRRSGRSDREYLIGGRDFGAITIGLSGAATSNSGFIMLGAVGLGYQFGMTFVFLPLAWLLGDLAFWRSMPQRLNRAARAAEAYTFPEFITGGASDYKRVTRVALGVAMVVVLGAYSTSQFIASAKTLGTAFSLDRSVAILVSGAIIAGYSLWGGMRASVWTDVYQAVLMIVVTAVALVSAVFVLSTETAVMGGEVLKTFWTPFSGWTTSAVIGFVVGWAIAAFCFDSSQPQVVVRFFAARSEADVKRARWIYIGVLQFTWIGMTVFGALARMLFEQSGDPELVLLTFGEKSLHPAIFGVIIAGVFAAIASTLDSITHAVGGILVHDVAATVLPQRVGKALGRTGHIVGGLLFLGAAMMMTVYSTSSVFELSAMAVSMLAVTLAPATLARLTWPDIRNSWLLGSVLVGLAFFLVWRNFGLDQVVNESVGCVPIFGCLALVHVLEKRRRLVPLRDAD